MIIIQGCVTNSSDSFTNQILTLHSINLEVITQFMYLIFCNYQQWLNFSPSTYLILCSFKFSVSCLHSFLFFQHHIFLFFYCRTYVSSKSGQLATGAVRRFLSFRLNKSEPAVLSWAEQRPLNPNKKTGNFTNLSRATFLRYS